MEENNKQNNEDNNNNQEEILKKIFNKIDTEFNEKMGNSYHKNNEIIKKTQEFLEKKIQKHGEKLIQEIEKKCIIKKENDNKININPQKGNKKICQTLGINIINFQENIKKINEATNTNFELAETITINSLNECLNDATNNFLKEKNEEKLENHIYNCFSYTHLFNMSTQYDLYELTYNQVRENIKKMI
jgi:hypothetical protein